jgi:hypothetical protein
MNILGRGCASRLHSQSHAFGHWQSGKCTSSPKLECRDGQTVKESRDIYVITAQPFESSKTCRILLLTTRHHRMDAPIGDKSLPFIRYRHMRASSMKNDYNSGISVIAKRGSPAKDSICPPNFHMTNTGQVAFRSRGITLKLAKT